MKRPTIPILLLLASGARRIWFLMNEDLADRCVEIALPSPVARYDSETDALESVPVDPDGLLRRVFSPGETALYVSDPDFNPRSADLQPRSGDLTWTLRPLVSHIAGSTDFELRSCDEPARPVALGDDAIRDRIQRAWPPVGPYDARQRTFDRDNRASGLFGPVTRQETET